ncbi:MAG TPA: radical SAM protein, partial [Thermodesulfovibrionia bacterium]|nr:radical SAM protein [Thermodesulfovibrionia bacterium]
MSRVLRQNSRHLLEAETGTIHKDPGGRITVCLISPNTYSVGMSGLGFQKVYHMVNSEADALCERAFLPDSEALKEHLRTGTELFSLES